MVNGTDSPWTDEKVADLRRLIKSGMSAGQAAVVLGVSRNAVISKVGRVEGIALKSPTPPSADSYRKRGRPVPVLPISLPEVNFGSGGSTKE